jgi:hypothetical protein
LYDIMFHTYRRLLTRGKLLDFTSPDLSNVFELVSDSHNIVERYYLK